MLRSFPSLALLLAFGFLPARANITEPSQISWAEAEFKASQVLNYEVLFPVEQEKLIERVMFWENESEEFAKVPQSERLPHSLVMISRKEKSSHIIEESPFKKANYRLNWIPNIDLFYELMVVNQQMQETYGKSHCPPVHLVMALLSQETRMRNILGDGGQSIHMCQLYRPSAKYITGQSRNRDIFKKLVYFDDKDFHHFYSQRAMLEFVYHFLILEKRYSNANESKGVAAYNGGGERARQYGKSVLLKALYYQGLSKALKAGSPTIALKELKDWSKSPLDIRFINIAGFRQEKDETDQAPQALTQEEEREVNLFKFTIYQHLEELIATIDFRQPTYFPSSQKIVLETTEYTVYSAIKVFPKKLESRKKVVADQGYFFFIEQGRTVFSYLRENTFAVMEENGFYFYFYEAGEKIFPEGKEAFEQAATRGAIMLCNARPGDKVYIEKGTPVYGVEQDDLQLRADAR